MLPKSRIISVLVMGLGLALVAWGILWPRMVTMDARLPLDLEHTTFSLVDPAAEVANAEDPTATRTIELTRQVHFDLQPPVNKDTVAVRAGVSVFAGPMDELDNLQSASVWSYQMERASGMPTTDATVSTQLASPAEEIPLDGLWLKFPTDAQRTEYPVFDPILRTSAPATFTEELEQDGRVVYRYLQEIEPVNLAQTTGVLGSVLTIGEQQVELYYQATREFTVDATSGLVLNIQEQVDSYYAQQDGQRVATALRTDAQMTEQDQAAMRAQAAGVSDGNIARMSNYFVIGVGAHLAVLGLTFAYAGGRRQEGNETR